MRQGEKHAIEIFQAVQIIRRFGKSKLSQPEKIAVDFADRLAGVLIRGDEFDFNVRMRE